MREKYRNVDGIDFDDYDSEDYERMIDSLARGAVQEPDPYGFYEREEELAEEEANKYGMDR